MPLNSRLMDCIFYCYQRRLRPDLFIGIIAYIVISAIQVAGGFIDFQMGFAIANVIHPQTGAQSPLFGQFFNVLAMLLLLTVNGNHMLLDGIFYSYRFIPIDTALAILRKERLN